ncbi:DUF6252 family protein [Hymenobacter convexus]|uniref:DUF6252 family protein n=1 Tax=Hymenobacter sp. CA1UV-4 TaxID=3063782 RepID=UPI002714438C|nr:DUF6252 family protein [Hymenobacter sp. CA1UV-4]MDO7850736.1 DUF6252 family protein [Hymenobacter sp. CA1UV-4]
MKRKFLLYLCLATLTQCSKCKNDPTPADPAAQLPPATQTGANTFGCLVNGQPYTPGGGSNGTPSYAVIYDPGYQGGSLDVRTYRYPDAQSLKKQRLSLGGININHAGVYLIGASPDTGAGFTDEYRTSPCDTYRSDQANGYSKGSITITRLDLQAGIISGTFAFTLAQPGCDTIKVTQGRFDKKL